MPGQIVRGKVTKLTNFGVFVELEEELEGLLHVSEMADHKVENPQDIVKVGDEVEVKILRVDTDERKIGLSLKRAQWAAEDQGGGETTGGGGAEGPVKRRGGLESEGGLGDLTFIPTANPPQPKADDEGKDETK
jgi:small subunit ribosomal protein S1